MKALEIMTRSDTSMLQMLGASLMCRIAPADSEQIANAREEDARRAHLTSMGMNPDPPADWMPKKESAISNALAKCGAAPN